MVETHNLDATGKTGAEWSVNVNDTVNRLSGMVLGRLIDVAGTNALTANLALATGFSGLADDARCELVPVITSTGPVTLNVAGFGAVPVKRANGEALAIGALLAGTIYSLSYNLTDAYWRVVGGLSGADASDKQYPLIFVEEISASTVYVVGWDCYISFHVFGGSGSGAACTSGSKRAAGGGSGGTCIKNSFFVAAGTEFTITVGAGGAGVSANSSGNDGVDSRVVQAFLGLDLLAQGGAGGEYTSSGTADGGVGGAASGGDHDWAGGNGADAGNADRGGGGARGLIQDGFSAFGVDGSGDGAGLLGNDSSLVYSAITIPPFVVVGNRGGVPGYETGGGGGFYDVDPVAGDAFCGGPGTSDGVMPAQPFLGGGSGGCSDTDSGNGGAGAVIIQYSSVVS